MTERVAAKGWIGLTWPKEYGGQARSALERYVVTEELLAAAVPVGAHWVAVRQSGPVMLKFGSEEQTSDYLSRITVGECYCYIGMRGPVSCTDADSLTAPAAKIAERGKKQGP